LQNANAKPIAYFAKELMYDDLFTLKFTTFVYKMLKYK